MMSSFSNVWLSMAAGLFSTGLHLLTYAIFLGVAFVSIRRTRPDAWTLVAGWAGAAIALQIVQLIANTIVPAAAGRGGTDTLIASMATLTACFAVLRAGVDILLLLALLKLAAGRPQDPFPSPR